MNKSNLRRELGRQLRDFKYEIGDQGEVVFSESGLQIGGVFSVENLTKGDGVQYVYNRVVTQGLNHVLDVILGTVAKVTTWYLAPFAANVTPAASLTASNFHATTTEFTFYTDSERPAFAPTAAAATGVIGNLGSRAEITLGGGGTAQTTIHGLGVLSIAAKQSPAGVLLSAARLPSARSNLEPDDVIALGYQLTLSDAS